MFFFFNCLPITDTSPLVAQFSLDPSCQTRHCSFLLKMCEFLGQVDEQKIQLR